MVKYLVNYDWSVSVGLLMCCYQWRLVGEDDGRVQWCRSSAWRWRWEDPHCGWRHWDTDTDQWHCTDMCWWQLRCDISRYRQQRCLHSTRSSITGLNLYLSLPLINVFNSISIYFSSRLKAHDTNSYTVKYILKNYCRYQTETDREIYSL